MVKNIVLNKEKSLQSVFWGWFVVLGQGREMEFWACWGVADGWCGALFAGGAVCFVFFIATFSILACNLLCICENIYLNLQ